MKILKWRFVFIILSMFFLLLGCTSQSTIKSIKSQSSKHTQTSKKEVKENGHLLSLTKIKIQQEYDLQAYRMTYWSDGVKTVAYVTAPKVSGDYPLKVELHGSETLPTSKKHLTSITYEGETYTTASSSEIEPSVFTLAPMYRGYEKSDGTVQGLNGDTVDTEMRLKL